MPFYRVLGLCERSILEHSTIVLQGKKQTIVSTNFRSTNEGLRRNLKIAVTTRKTGRKTTRHEVDYRIRSRGQDDLFDLGGKYDKIR